MRAAVGSFSFAAIQQAIKNPAYDGVLNQYLSEIVISICAQLRSIVPGIGGQLGLMISLCD